MSRLFILFLIALLPLRGWTAERMVVQMDHGAARVQLPGAIAAMSAECALHMQMVQQTSARAQAAQPDAAAHASHGGCQNCQLCMPLAALDSATPLAALPQPKALPLGGSSRFVSADPARNAKPPIS